MSDVDIVPGSDCQLGRAYVLKSDYDRPAGDYDRLLAQRDKLEKENDHMRGLLANGSDPCIYCGLLASEMGRCESGFPGCARGDDMMNAPPECENWTRKGRSRS